MKFLIDRKYIDDGLVTERSHPVEPYLIYNYTPNCQYSKAWDDVTVQCRGLIVHKDTREVIARPFRKFFNYEEHAEKGIPIPDGVPDVYDKRDGSLGILYHGVNGDKYIATRGSFCSDQATWATEWLRKNNFHGFNRGYTYLFEIIYPENRIVLDYGDYCGLDLLAVIDTDTGSEVDINSYNWWNPSPLGTPIVPLEFTDYHELKSRNDKNKEGFVLKYPCGTRIKIKFDEYVRLHKIICGLSEIGIWEQLKDGKTTADIIADTPDEMHGWVIDVTTRILAAYNMIAFEANKQFGDINMSKVVNRKDAAELIRNMTHPSLGFLLLDNKPFRDSIWKMVRPSGSVTFRKEV